MALTFLTGGADGAGVTLSYSELDALARSFAAVLQDAGAAHRRVLLLFSPGIDYIVGFLGCLYAGAVPVPAYPPGPARANRHLARLEELIADADVELVLTTRSIAQTATSDALARRGGRLRWLVAEDVDIGAADAWHPPEQPAEPIAFLQYSSGSTGAPKGVIVSHASLAANLAAIERSFEIRRDDTAVLWLPPYHDMGLIGGILSPLWSGYRVVLLAPGSFLQRPLGWLRAIARHGGTIAGGPNFAFELCARRATPADLAGLDLRRWQVAFSGAEPIRAATLERFAEVFAPCGFDRRAFYACYGLAEATLLVTGSRRGTPPRVRQLDRDELEAGRVRDADAQGRAGVAAVGCGRAPDGHDVAIVAPEASVRLPPGEVGEIWVSGPSVARGYWGQPALAAQVFEATIAGDPDRRYLRTGDLGFISDGELFVTGRIKDLLILRGRNVYPQDVELTVEQADPAIRFGGCAAFGIEVHGEERLVVAAETELRRGGDDTVAQRVIEAVRHAVADHHSVDVHAVVLVAARSIPKTSSGKIRRRTCRAAYLAGKLDVITASVASAEAEAVIAGIWAEVLGHEQIGADDDFFALGGHSLLATQVVARVRSKFGVELPLRALFEDASVARLARRIAAVRADDADGDPGRAPDAIEGTPPLRPRPAGTVDHLSFAQQRLWFLDQLTPGSAAYNIPGAVRVRGPLDVGALERSFAEIVRRHAAVRTRIATVDGEPAPILVDDPAFTLAVSEATDEGEIGALATGEARRPFDLASGSPLLRARLVRLATDHHILLLTMHHIASDGWSFGVLVREIGVLYAAFTRGEASPLPPLAVQYADYAAWQRDWLDGLVLERQLAYWRGQLAGAPAALDLPTDRPRAATPGQRGAQLPVALPPAVVAPLVALARQEGATIYMALLAAFQVLLARYTGQSDILVGTPIAGRRRVELEGLIGFFVNTLVMRGDVSGAPSFRALLGRTRRVALDAYAHQDVPFEKLVEDIAPARDPGRTPLFQVMFILQNAPLPTLDLAGVTIEPVNVDPGTAKFDLTLSLESAADGGLRGSLEYDTDLFDAPTVQRLVMHYAALIQAVGAAPDLPVSEISLLSAAERGHLLALSGGAATEPPAPTLHALFDAQVARTPDAPALLTDDGALSYTELAHRANQLAHQLRALGVGPETRVGLYLRRSVDYVTAALAVLKAGGAYVPLDPAYPAARIQYMMSVATVELVVAASAPPGTSRWLDAADPAIAAQPTHAPPIAAWPDSVAYVVFTSGSTGDPNGVAGLHRGMVQRFTWMWERYPFLPGEVSALKTSPNFGDSVWETFGPLLQGVPSRVVSDDTARDPAALVDVLAASRVTRLVVVPSLLRALLEQPELDRRLPAHAVWTSSGEALPLDLLEQFRARLPGRTLLNLYGSSEASADSTAIDATAETRVATPTIGRPITGTRVYVLDDQLQPVPIGIPGLLHVAGEGLARGYLQQPALTAGRFVPDPWAPSPGARMYCTGDVARVRDDGTLDYLGRRDRQIKIRGMRVDPGEVESVLRRLDLVKDAAVAARDQRLIGYVVLAPGATIAGVRERLRERLPEHVIPGALVPLAALPLTPSGKVDRRALPEPTYERVIERRPSPGLEEITAGIWAEVLGLPEIGADDDFFELGGHSLLATQVVARVRGALGVELPVRALFEDASLGRFARRIAAASDPSRPRASVDGAPAAAIVRAPHDGEPPLSCAQERMWFLHAFAPDSPAYNMPAVVRLQGALDSGALEAAVADLVARHQALRTRVAFSGDRPVQRIDVQARFGWSTGDVASEEDVAAIARDEASRPFDLATGPLVRAVLLRRAVDDHHLILTLHHFAGDAWTLGILFRELGVLYSARRRGVPAALPAVAVDYADFAIWQRRWLEDGESARQLAYWRARLDGVAALELPCDRPRPAVHSLRGDVLPVRLPADLAAALRKVARSEGASLFMVVLAAWTVVLHRHTGQDDLAIGTPIANRHHHELEELVGLLVNTLVIRTDLSGRPTFREVLRRVRDASLDAYAHQDLPFEKLVEELRPLRDPSRSPLFQVMFALNNVRPPQVDLDGLNASARAIDNGTVKFDLGLALDETPGGLEGAIEYSSDLFDRPTIERLRSHLAQVLREVLARPDEAVSALRLHGDAERAQLLAWGRPATAPAPATAHALIEARARRSPDALAVTSETGQLTYRALDERAGALATRLRAAGVRDGDLVGIYLERSLEQIITVLAVLKAGAGYVPLDPEFSAARLGPVLAERALTVVATRAAHAPEIARYGGAVFDVPAALAADPDGAPPPPSRVSPEDLAYVIYTSGSSGRPKGVMISHRALASYARCAAARYGVDERDRHLQLNSLSFDASINEIFVPLIAGGTVVLRDADMMRSAAAFLDGCRRRRVTVLELPTAFWHTLVVALHEDGLVLPDTVRVVVLGGERVRPDRLAAWHQRVSPAVQLRNGYGPTEATVVATCADLDAGAAIRPGEVSIGRAISTMGAYVLDAGLALVPIGVVGELWLCGDGLARGYLGDPALTASRFVPDPHGDQPGARMYRTGDLCRVRPDGELEFLGRRDEQVKIRGFRVELGEIEAVLRTCAGVRDALVVFSADGAREARLIGYAVAGAEVSAANLRAQLAARLPVYMVPAVIVRLDRFPMSASGKVDRRALPAPRRDEAAARAPRTRVEARMVALWEQTLEVEAVDPDQDFFELGGHSLLAMRLAARVGSAFGVELPVRAVFEAPTPASLAVRVTQAQGTGVAPRPLAPLPDGAELPASFAQERLWLEARLTADDITAGHHLSGTLHVQGALDVGALEHALASLVARHDILRTRLVERGGRLVQEILPAVPFALAIDDLSSLPPAVAEEAAARRIRDDIDRPLDLAAPPPLRARLVRLGADQHRLAITIHHIACDPWSLELLHRELAVLYRARVRGSVADLPPLAMRYADFAAWQRAGLPGAALDAEIAHWRRTLAGAPVALELPIRRPGPRHGSGHAAAVRHTLDATLASLVRDFARRESASPFMTFLAAYHAVIHRYTGQTDLVIGTTMSDRPHPALEGVVGCFVDLLALRTELGPDPTFRSIVRRTRETAVTAFTHRDLSFQKLIEAINPERGGHSLPFMHLLFAFHDQASPRLVLDDGVVATLVEELPGQVAYELLLSVEARPDGGFDVTWMYDTAVFEATAIERLAAHHERLLRAALVAPELPIRAVPLVPDAELAMLRTFGRAAGSFPGDDTLSDRFAAQVRRTPDAVAVVRGNEQLTYAGLARRVEALAGALVQRGARPEAVVAVGLERSLELVVAILAVHRAGAAYLPLDPGYPADRLAFMLSDAGASLLVTTAALRHAFGPSCVPVLELDGELPPSGAPCLPVTPALPDNLAYVIYTSGSTGQPKGVLVTHRNALWLFDASRAWCEFGERDVWTLFHSAAFDFSVWELWGALLHGGRLVIVPRDTARDATAFHHLLRAQGVTIVNQTPSAFYELVRVDTAGAGPLPELRLLIVAGETLELARLAPWFRAHGDEQPRLINGYGVTETTVLATYRPLTRCDALAAGSPIGRPIPDLSLHVLDRHGELVPIGVPGELYIGGAGVARGYLDRPVLTAARFVPDPFSDRPGARLYRTGDRVRWLPGGDLDFLGRIDNQVKIRGFRIELGEIESVLAAHPGVRELAVVVAGERAEDRHLVAHVALHDPASATPDELRRFLGERLPPYMVPGSIAVHDALPHGATGKLDRQALARHAAPVDHAGDARLSPQTHLESEIARMWRELSGGRDIAMSDDFFAVGGHSLLAAQLAARIHEVTGVDLGLRVIFEASTIAQLADEIETRRRDKTAAEHPLEPRPRGSAPVMSSAQQRLWFLAQLDPSSPAYNVPGVVQLIGTLRVDLLARCLMEVIARHEVLRTCFGERDGRPHLTVRDAASIAASIELPVEDLRSVPAAERDARAAACAAEEAARPFDLAHAPLIRARLLRLADDRHLLLVTLHHIVSDGWSLGVLFREVTAAYEAFARGRPSSLPALPVQYADFAHWQQERLSRGIDDRLDYWRRTLAGAVPQIALPFDRPRPHTQRNVGRMISLGLDAAPTLAARDIAQQEHATLYMVLLAAFYALLFRLTGADDLVVGTPVANRRHPLIEGLIGFFVNTLPLRCQVRGDQRFTDLVRDVRRLTLEAYDHEDVPFERIVDDLAIERSLSRNPLVQVLFVLQNAPMPPLRLAGLEVAHAAAPLDAVKLDLVVILEEDGDALAVHWNYDVDLFEESTIRRLHEQYRGVLAQVTAEPLRGLRDLAIDPATRAAQATAVEALHAADFGRLGQIRPVAVTTTLPVAVPADRTTPAEPDET